MLVSVIVAIGWLYVVILMAATQPSLLAAGLTLIGYGLFPLAIVLYLLDAPRRARKRRAAAAQPPSDDRR
ncbi:MAG: hypothetical protein R3E87_08530 [Burkholderiaceae bacterium]